MRSTLRQFSLNSLNSSWALLAAALNIPPSFPKLEGSFRLFMPRFLSKLQIVFGLFFFHRSIFDNKFYNSSGITRFSELDNYRKSERAGLGIYERLTNLYDSVRRWHGDRESKSLVGWKATCGFLYDQPSRQSKERVKQKAFQTCQVWVYHLGHLPESSA